MILLDEAAVEGFLYSDAARPITNITLSLDYGWLVGVAYNTHGK